MSRYFFDPGLPGRTGFWFPEDKDMDDWPSALGYQVDDPFHYIREEVRLTFVETYVQKRDEAVEILTRISGELKGISPRYNELAWQLENATDILYDPGYNTLVLIGQGFSVIWDIPTMDSVEDFIKYQKELYLAQYETSEDQRLWNKRFEELAEDDTSSLEQVLEDL